MERRAYRGADDYQSSIDLWLPAVRAGDYPNAEILTELLTSSPSNPTDNVCLWEGSAGKLVGAAVLHLPWNNLLMVVHPDVPPADEQAMRHDMIAWGAVRLQQVSTGSAAPVALDVACHEDDTALVALLEEQGFTRVEGDTLRMVRSLDELIPEPHLPAGFSFRCVAGEHEAAQWVELRNDAFGNQYATVEQRLAEMRKPGYVPALDLMVAAPDGTWAAFCMCNLDAYESARAGQGWGWTDPIGTRPAYRRQGLARAVILAGLRALKSTGAKTAILGTMSTNTAAIQLYESLGYRVLYRLIWYSKPL
ncbi:MAG: GNAT family N-acetyltransferase [Anaerolineae bacterium]|nr:GNAT family N-acetyltransferase [Anaerolineae bacterium]